MTPTGSSRRDAALRAANRARGFSGVWWPWRRGAARPPAGPRRAPAGRPRSRGIRDVWRGVLVAALVLFVLVRTFLVEAYRIPSGSMERTLLTGDFLLVNKALYGAEIPFTSRRLPGVRAPRPNDIIVFTWPVDPSKNFVKRLAGVAGDTLAMRGGRLERNGRAVTEPWVYRTQGPVGPADSLRDDWGPLVVPARQLFVLGDHRDDSLDSRYWGFVPDSLLVGAPWVVYFSFSHDSSATVPWLTRIRWPRIGTVIR